MNPEWRRIAGLRVEEDGTVACVWLALEPDAEIIHVYDCCLWANETFPVMFDAIANRGRWIPMAWSNEAFSEKLLNDWGVNMLPDPIDKDPSVAAVETRGVWQRMRAQQFKAKKGLRQWIEEWKTFQREQGKVPLDSHPLMTATWYAVSQAQYAKAQHAMKTHKRTAPKLALV